MKYRFPSAMGEAEAAGHYFSPDWLENLREESLKELYTHDVFPPEMEKVLDEDCRLLEVILHALEKCPSRDFILHHGDGRIVQDIKELEETDA